FIRTRKAVPGADADSACSRAIPFRPGGKQPAEIKQRIADGSQFPVNNGGKLGPVITEHHIGEMIVAMDDTGDKVIGPMTLKPFRHLGDAGNTFWPRP